jgi:amino-acid N-acetyltransferase
MAELTREKWALERASAQALERASVQAPGRASVQAPGRASVQVRPARVGDLAVLEGFIAAYTGDGTLLARSRTNLVHYVRDFRLAVDGSGRLIGSGALQLVSETLAEIRSLAVDPAWRGAGLGSRIVRVLLDDARRLGVERVFCLTRRTDFFAHLGFAVAPMERYPDKIWNDCRLCPRREACDEIAMELAISSVELASGL